MKGKAFNPNKKSPMERIAMFPNEPLEVSVSCSCSCFFEHLFFSSSPLIFEILCFFSFFFLLSLTLPVLAGSDFGASWCQDLLQTLSCLFISNKHSTVVTHLQSAHHRKALAVIDMQLVNRSAVHFVKILEPRLIDLACVAHICDILGSKVLTPELDHF
jgi:hypothetical protein